MYRVAVLSSLLSDQNDQNYLYRTEGENKSQQRKTADLLGFCWVFRMSRKLPKPKSVDISRVSLYTLQYIIFFVYSQVLFHVVIYHAVSWESNPLFARVFTIFRVCIGFYRDVVFYCIIFHNQLGFWWVRWVFDGDTQKDSTEGNYSRYPMYIFLVILVTIRF